MASTISSVDLGLLPSLRMADRACFVTPPAPSNGNEVEDSAADEFLVHITISYYVGAR